MSSFSGKHNPRNCVSLSSGRMEEPKESPRLAAMQRMRAKRAQQRDQRSSKARKTSMAVHHNQPVQLPPLASASQLSLLLPPQPPPPPRPPPSPKRPITRILTMRKPTNMTLNLFPKNDETPTSKSNIIGVRRAWVTRVDGERMTGLLRWSETVNDLIINCDCHNLMFSPEGFLNHAGLKGISMDRPLRHIIVSMVPFSQEQ